MDKTSLFLGTLSFSPWATLSHMVAPHNSSTRKKKQEIEFIAH